MSAKHTESTQTAEAARPNRRPARQRIFDAAKELFYTNGIRAVGVEGIAAHAGTTKMSLYRNFDSKDELVAECLRDHQRDFWEWWNSVTEPLAGDPKAQLLALIDAFVGANCSNDSHGCPLANAIVEIQQDDHPGRKVIMEHKNRMRSSIGELCRQAGARDPDQLGDALMLLVEGGYVSRLTFQCRQGPIHSLPWAARQLIGSQLTDST
jgi:AcrR family transcriptional regulator